MREDRAWGGLRREDTDRRKKAGQGEERMTERSRRTEVSGGRREVSGRSFGGQ